MMTRKSTTIALAALVLGAAAGWFAALLAHDQQRPDAEWVAMNWTELLGRVSDSGGALHDDTTVAAVTAQSLMVQTTALARHFDTITDPLMRAGILQRLDRLDTVLAQLEPPVHTTPSLEQARHASACLRESAATETSASECFATRETHSRS